MCGKFVRSRILPCTPWGGKYLHISVGTVPQSVLPATSARSERSERKYCSIQESSVMQFFWVDGCALNDTIMYRRR